MIQTFIPYARQNINQEDCHAVIEALQADVITRGSYVERFEQAVASFCQARYAVSFHSGTTALHAAYFAAEVGNSHRVITTPNTFLGTFIGALHLGAEVKFVDIDRETGNLNVESMTQHLLPKNNILVPVHFSGLPVDIERMRELAPEAIIIEDAAHAFGSSHPNGLPVGSCYASDMTVLSFHPAKTITTGEGGMVTTHNPKLYERLKLFRNNGIVRGGEQDYPGFYSVEHVTGNYNFTDFQAALGLSQLNRIRSFVEGRRELLALYRQYLAEQPYIRLFSAKFDSLSAHHLCVAQIDFDKFGKTRKQIMHALKERGIGTQVHYIPAYHHPVVPSTVPLPETERYYAQALTLPLYIGLQSADIKKICNDLLNLLHS